MDALVSLAGPGAADERFGRDDGDGDGEVRCRTRRCGSVAASSGRGRLSCETELLEVM